MENKLQLRIENLTIGYGKGKTRKPVLTDLNITTESGSLIALVGSNGKGKSTLLKTIAGLLNPLNGNIYINNRELSTIDRLSRAKLISYVGTSHEINKSLKVRDLVALGRYPYSNIFG
ncbi:MAG TPA: ABC transporter ATP-binding protein, partial [Salinivirgaceae bacterium]|nr:ABC transporter ATP-binding protein [Salinivirgaceae bacterium]